MRGYNTPAGAAEEDVCCFREVDGMRSQRALWIVAAVALLLTLAAGCLSQTEDEGPAIERGPAHRTTQGEAAAPVKPGDMDLAGSEDPELDEIARAVLTTRGAFRGAEEVSEDEWMGFRTRLEDKLKDSPSAFGYWLLAGVRNALEEGSPEALEAAREAVKLAPDSAWAYDHLGFILKSAGMDAEAEDALKTAMSLAEGKRRPPHLKLMAGGRDDDVMTGGRDDDVMRGGRDDDVLSGGRDDDVLRSLQEGRPLTFANLRFEHLMPSGELLKELPSEPEELQKLGLAGYEGDEEVLRAARGLITPAGYIRKPRDLEPDEWHKRVKMLKYIHEHRPTAFNSWLLAGMLLHDARYGDAATVGPALRAAQKAVEAAPDSARAHFILGVAHYFNKNVKAAAEEFGEAKRLNDRLAAPHFALADMALRQQDHLTAAKHLKAVMQMRKAEDPEYQAAAGRLKAITERK